VIIDSNGYSDLLSHVLRAGGWAVRTRAGMQGAYTAIKSGGHDLIILDLPACCTDSVWNLLTTLQLDSELRQTPLIVCSPATDELLAREEWLQHHDVNIVRKPFDLDELNATIEEMLGLQTSA
jgi:CheY-like chemotaxis protein